MSITRPQRFHFNGWLKRWHRSTRHAWLAAGQALALALAPLGAQAAYTAVNVKFACQQETCDGELWLPQGVQKPPVILMAHGLGAEKDWGLKPYAQVFVDAGFAVFRFDYRGFGLSGGKPRGLVDGKAHVKDWSAAVDAIQKRTDVDASRMGLWGTSYSGGHVLALAAQRPTEFKAVSSQVPFVNGLQSSLKYPIKYQPLAFWYGLRDWLRGPDSPPITVPLASKDKFAIMVCAECDLYAKLAPADRQHTLQAPARLFMTLPFYAPGSTAHLIQAPTLIMAAENDGLVPVQGVRDVAKTIKHVTYVELKGADHFQPYFGELFKRGSAQQLAFFKQHL